MKKSNYSITLTTVYLIIFTLLVSIYAGDASNVLAITCDSENTNYQTEPFNLVSISSNDSREIGKLENHMLYGMDENVVAILQTQGTYPKRESRLLVVDRKTSAVLVDTNLNNFGPMVYMNPIYEELVVQSKNSDVYFIDANKKEGWGIAKVNWKTGIEHRIPLQASNVFYMSSLKAVPNGLVFGFTIRDKPALPSSDRRFITIYDTSIQKIVLTLNAGESRQFTRLFSVPDFGLMHYYNGMLVRLTDQNFSTAMQNPAGFPSAGVDIRSKVSIQTINGKPSLIWGENTNSDMGSISELVEFDLESEKEIWRKSLGADVSPNFQPDQTGDNIYYVKPYGNEIFCLNKKSQMISSFAKMGKPNTVVMALLDAH